MHCFSYRSFLRTRTQVRHECTHASPWRKAIFKTFKIDISAVRSRQATHLSFREELYESEVTDFVASQTLYMHAIAIEAWASGRF